MRLRNFNTFYIKENLKDSIGHIFDRLTDNGFSCEFIEGKVANANQTTNNFIESHIIEKVRKNKKVIPKITTCVNSILKSKNIATEIYFESRKMTKKIILSDRDEMRMSICEIIDRLSEDYAVFYFIYWDKNLFAITFDIYPKSRESDYLKKFAIGVDYYYGPDTESHENKWV